MKHHFLEELQIIGESLKDGNLIAISTVVIGGNNMWVIDPAHICPRCGANYRRYKRNVDGN